MLGNHRRDHNRPNGRIDIILRLLRRTVTQVEDNGDDDGGAEKPRPSRSPGPGARGPPLILRFRLHRICLLLRHSHSPFQGSLALFQVGPVTDRHLKEQELPTRREVEQRTCLSPEPLYPLTASVLIRRATRVPRFISALRCVQKTLARGNTKGVGCFARKLA